MRTYQVDTIALVGKLFLVLVAMDSPGYDNLLLFLPLDMRTYQVDTIALVGKLLMAMDSPGYDNLPGRHCSPGE